MSHNCPCPKNGCTKTARYLKHRLKNWDGRVCPHCGNPITKPGSDECPCAYKFCPCMSRDVKREHTKDVCPCIEAKCDCLKITKVPLYRIYKT